MSSVVVVKKNKRSGYNHNGNFTWFALSPSAKRGNLLACFLPSFSLGLIFFGIDVILT